MMITGSPANASPLGIDIVAMRKAAGNPADIVVLKVAVSAHTNGETSVTGMSSRRH
jgi:hypothetical protein